MLRPTESRILWLQQFGRGLRKKKDDKPLAVIDYIGNHRTFYWRLLARGRLESKP
jgi:superfamily II DNA or RNA helicase